MKLAHTGEGPKQEDAILRMQCTALCCTALHCTASVCCARGARLISTRASVVVVQYVLVVLHMVYVAPQQAVVGQSLFLVSPPSFHHSFPRENMLVFISDALCQPNTPLPPLPSLPLGKGRILIHPPYISPTVSMTREPHAFLLMGPFWE